MTTARLDLGHRCVAIVTDNPRLSAIIKRSMRACRKDLGRMLADFDYCEVCPLLDICVAQEREEKDQDESRLDHDGDNAQARAEQARIRAETKARGGIGI